MKPEPPPHVPGNTEADKFHNAVPMFSVSKEELQEREAQWKRAQEKKKQAKKSA